MGALQVVSEQELKHLGLLGSKRSYIFRFGTNDWVLPCDNRDQQVTRFGNPGTVFNQCHKVYVWWSYILNLNQHFEEISWIGSEVYISFFTCNLVGIAKSIQLTLGWISIQQYLGYMSGHPISHMQSTPQLW